MREKLRRALHYERAGLRVPTEVPLLRERSVEDGLQEAETEFKVAIKATEETGLQADLKKETKFKACNGLSTSSMRSCESSGELCGDSKHALKVQHTTRKSAIIDQTRVGTETLSVVSSDLGNGFKDARYGTDNDSSMEERPNAVAILPSRKAGKYFKEHEDSGNDNSRERRVASKQKKSKKGKQLAESSDVDRVGDELSKVEKVQGGIMDSDAFKADGDGGSKVVVHVWRPEEVKNAREKLPIIMMEQEIMEAITENSITIICGETGCGKTTQVPQVQRVNFIELSVHGMLY